MLRSINRVCMQASVTVRNYGARNLKIPQVQRTLTMKEESDLLDHSPEGELSMYTFDQSDDFENDLNETATNNAETLLAGAPPTWFNVSKSPSKGSRM